MASLVADYGNSSGSDNESENSSQNQNSSFEVEKNLESEENDDIDSEEDDQDNSSKNINSSDERLPLPTPNFNSTPTMKTSVFSNPFVEAEKAKSAILEKHVKMTPTLDDTKMINGKKICWNYRKGRCRFGHNCTFAHDSDLHRSKSELETMNSPQETIVCQAQYTNGNFNETEEVEVDQENNQQMALKKKKRPGLSQGLVPGKKVLKMYKSQQAKTSVR